MKVADLIEFLNRQDPEALVVVDGYEDGLDDDVSVVAAPIELNVHEDEWWNGRHDRAVAPRKSLALATGIAACR